MRETESLEQSTVGGWHSRFKTNTNMSVRAHGPPAAKWHDPVVDSVFLGPVSVPPKLGQTAALPRRWV